MKRASLFLIKTGNFRQFCVVGVFGFGGFFKDIKNNVQTL